MIEITGAGCGNKGAELLLLAARDAIRQRLGPHVRLCAVLPLRNRGQFPILDGLDVLNCLRGKRNGCDIGWFANRLPRRLVESAGCARPRDVRVVLDASGFRYSSQWGKEAGRDECAYYRNLNARGAKIVLLPQSFGPFDKGSAARHIAEICDIAELVYARDRSSMEALRTICPERAVDRIGLCPDITVAFMPTKDAALRYDAGKRRMVCVIPNRRMIDKTSPETAAEYVRWLATLIQKIQATAFDVTIVNHEGLDEMKLCSELAGPTGAAVFDEPHPVKLKVFIGTARCVISSRFHGLVNALSQDVPVFAAGWSHKYRELLDDYGSAGELMTEFSEASDRVLVQKLSDDDWLNGCSERLSCRNEQFRQKISRMWDGVCSLAST